MNQLIWRLHRQQGAFALGGIVVLGVALAVTGAVMAGDYHSALSTCGSTASCGDLQGQLFQGDGFIIDLVRATLAAPLLLGLFWGAPLVGKELEDGTHHLAWTQCVTRRRWLLSNVGAAMVTAAIWTGILAALVTWWRGPEDALDGGRFGSSFDIVGVAPVAYTLFAVAVGILAGTLFRRVLPAMAVTLAAVVGIRAAVALWLRPHYLAPLHAAFALVDNASGAPAGAWVLARTVVSRTGQAVTSPASIPAACHAAYFRGSVTGCLAAHGYHRLVTYQPVGRFWAFQGIEAAIFLALAAILVAVAYSIVLRSDA